MSEPFSFGAPERRRFAMQFGYDVRPSFWQNVQSNSHLVIAAVGTVALLGVAAVALWLALPGNGRQTVASTGQTVPAVPVKTTKIAPAAANAVVTVAAAPQAARKADAVSPATAVREAAIPALASSSPRWNPAGSGTTPAPAEAAASPAPANQAASTESASNQPAASPPAAQKEAVAAYAEAPAENDASTALSEVAAPAPTDDQSAAGNNADAETAAIPEVKPQAPDADTAATGDNAAKPRQASAGANGHILRPVTMRAGPKKGAAAILTVPAKAPVQVMNCKQWCEIVYNGKHGWVYKSYVKTGA
ncbi:SH3 domain-containing protein [Mesorhizobium sp.]|uniref:SH3 domain-containing protein n=1 Tax=Mesorhizobium sp. TaxID=1871066 RepID=UPI0025F60AC3|nr:SH3 domain-containing protein [Mesorhizobium sp.]